MLIQYMIHSNHEKNTQISPPTNNPIHPKFTHSSAPLAPPRDNSPRGCFGVIPKKHSFPKIHTPSPKKSNKKHPHYFFLLTKYFFPGI